MSQWLDDVIGAARGLNDYLAPVRLQSLSRLSQHGWPGRRSEAWRFTPLTAAAKQPFRLVESAGQTDLPLVPGLSSIDIVLVDGHLVTDVSQLELPTGVSVISLTTQDRSEQQQISAAFAQTKPAHHLFGMINDAICQQGVLINIAANTVVDTPIRVLHLLSQPADGHSRVLVNVGENAQAILIEHGEGDADGMHTSFAEYHVGQGAQLMHYRFAFFTAAAKHAGGSHFKLQHKAQLDSTVVAYGSDMSRLDIDVEHAGEEAVASLNAIYLLAANELFDLHTTIEHAVPHGTTEENARGIIGDGARAVFNGRIHIHRDAQKTLAELNNRNLLLSRRGVINTKPELEIYADDVKCAHGATVAEIDDKALFYLLSRGVPRSRALVMLNFGFIQELVNRIPDPAIAEWLQDKLATRFQSMEVK